MLSSFLVGQDFLLLARLLELLLGLLVLIPVYRLGKGARLNVVVVEVDRLSVQETIRVHLGQLDQGLGSLAPLSLVLGVRGR